MKPPLTKFETRVYNATAGLVIAKATGDRLEQATYLGLLILAYWEAGQLYPVIGWCKEAVALFKGLGYQSYRRKFLYYLIEALLATDQNEAALPYLEEQLALVEQTAKDSLQEAAYLKRLGYHYLLLDRQVSALPYLKQAASRYAKLQQPGESFELLNQVGIILVKLGELVQAGHYFYKALAQANLSGIIAYEAQAFGNLGWLYLRLGHMEEGQLFYHHALERFRKLGDKDSELKALVELAQANLMELPYTS